MAETTSHLQRLMQEAEEEATALNLYHEPQYEEANPPMPPSAVPPAHARRISKTTAQLHLTRGPSKDPEAPVSPMEDEAYIEKALRYLQAHVRDPDNQDEPETSNSEEILEKMRTLQQEFVRENQLRKEENNQLHQALDELKCSIHVKSDAHEKNSSGSGDPVKPLDSSSSSSDTPKDDTKKADPDTSSPQLELEKQQPNPQVMISKRQLTSQRAKMQSIITKCRQENRRLKDELEKISTAKEHAEKTLNAEWTYRLAQKDSTISKLKHKLATINKTHKQQEGELQNEITELKEQNLKQATQHEQEMKKLQETILELREKNRQLEEFQAQAPPPPPPEPGTGITRRRRSETDREEGSRQEHELAQQFFGPRPSKECVEYVPRREIQASVTQKLEVIDGELFVQHLDFRERVCATESLADFLSHERSTRR